MNYTRQSAKSGFTTFHVKEEADLLSFVMDKMNGISRSKVKAILSGKGIRVNGRITSQFDFSLKPGMVVEVSKQPYKKKIKTDSPFFDIIYEDKWLIVIDKAPNVLSMAVGKNSVSLKSLLDGYFEYCGEPYTAHVVHRLDRNTSGLMVYAKSVEVQQAFINNWQDIITDRRYVAAVSGKMEQNDGRVASWLKDNSQYVTYSSPTDNGGKYAVTDYHTLQVGKNYSLVELKLQTGRKNQIRVHMQDIGHPVAGDLKYGSHDNPIDRLALHAFRLAFTHPVTHQPMNFETPIPNKFYRLIKREV